MSWTYVIKITQHILHIVIHLKIFFNPIYLHQERMEKVVLTFDKFSTVKFNDSSLSPEKGLFFVPGSFVKQMLFACIYYST